MVKNANISKGSLFNYFNSKKKLYVYIIEYGIQVIEQLYKEIDLDETDLFKRIEKIGLQKLYIHQEYPHVFDFLASVIQEESQEVRSIIKKNIDPVYERGTTLIYEHIDYSKFRKDIDTEKAVEIINWAMFGFGDKAIEEINTFENIDAFGDYYLKEWQVYSDILRKAFYK